MRLRGTKFNEYHTANTWGLVQNKATLTTPEVKKYKISVDGRSGDLDYTEALTGYVTYENRTASFIYLLTEGTHEEREALLTEINTALHGEYMTIIFNDDQNHYVEGRVEVKNSVNNASYATIELEADCMPWRYSINETNVSYTVSSEVSKTLTNNGKKPLIPTITVTGTVLLSFGSRSVSMTNGEYTIEDFILFKGSTPIVLSGSGTIKFTYREAVI